MPDNPDSPDPAAQPGDRANPGDLLGRLQDPSALFGPKPTPADEVPEIDLPPHGPNGLLKDISHQRIWCTVVWDLKGQAQYERGTRRIRLSIRSTDLELLHKFHAYTDLGRISRHPASTELGYYYLFLITNSAEVDVFERVYLPWCTQKKRDQFAKARARQTEHRQERFEQKQREATNTNWVDYPLVGETEEQYLARLARLGRVVPE